MFRKIREIFYQEPVDERALPTSTTVSIWFFMGIMITIGGILLWRFSPAEPQWAWTLFGLFLFACGLLVAFLTIVVSFLMAYLEWLRQKLGE